MLLWILGFRMPPAAVREALIKRLQRHDQKIGSDEDDREDFVSKLAVSTAKYLQRSHGAPRSIQHAITDVCLELLNVFYRTGEGDSFDELGSLWEQAAPYFSKSSQGDGERKVIPFKDIMAMMPFIKESAALPAQIEAVTAGTDYELVTTQRLMQLAKAFFRRMERASPEIDLASMKDQCEPMIFGLIPSLLPIAVSVIRNRTIRPQIVWIALEGLRMLRADA